MKHTNICIMGILGVKKKINGAERKNEDIIAEAF